MPSHPTDLPLHIYVSSALQKFLGIRPKDVPHASSLELPQTWWSIWRAELILTDRSGKRGYALFTNEATLFSFVIDVVYHELNAAITDFETLLLRQFHNEGLMLPPEVSTHYSLMKGRPNKLIGSMNMFIDHFMMQIDYHERLPQKTEEHLNNIPCGTLKYDRPGRAFKAAVQSKPPFGCPLTTSDNIIPFPGTKLSK